MELRRFSENPIIRLIMEVIQRDSQMHYRVQEWIADSLTGKPLTLTPDEVGDVWGMIEDHIKLERKTVELAEEAIAMIGGAKGMQLQAYLLQYLLEDEQKHNQLLDRLHGVAYEGFDRSVDAHVKNLRRKLEPDPTEPQYVLTVYGIGYKFADE